MRYVDPGDELKQSVEVQSAGGTPLPASLKSIARLLQTAARWSVLSTHIYTASDVTRLRTKAKCHALHMLCLICVDNRVLADADILLSIQDAIEAILCNFTDNQKLTSAVRSPNAQDETPSLIASQLSDILARLLRQITCPIMQQNLICALPTKSPMAAYFQRHTAMSFFLHPQVLEFTLADSRLPPLIHKHLDTSPHFRITKNTDYEILAARMTILDIASTLR